MRELNVPPGHDREYYVAKRISEICKESPTAEIASAVVKAEFPEFDMSLLPHLGSYFHRFNPKGNDYVRQRQAHSIQ